MEFIHDCLYSSMESYDLEWQDAVDCGGDAGTTLVWICKEFHHDGCEVGVGRIGIYLSWSG
eukprot:CAMPEP_0117439034 /NCGR_PEP_ID=MMETSP0759-20121206/2361_1 /TAXON_ID=63605 /ORGANISM="Percolomonas cosmopolitus, Strain WS" /LENGTH=60 /DNA_ID=CAMNT_0005230745 /DNA_START=292 /DNA_END=474 /DNA_ORIENTATION=+